jgi:hypothetical protein
MSVAKIYRGKSATIAHMAPTSAARRVVRNGDRGATAVRAAEGISSRSGATQPNAIVSKPEQSRTRLAAVTAMKL